MESTTEKTREPYLSIVIPVYNERENLVPLEKELTISLTKVNRSYEIIFIDDGSSDESADVIQSLKQNNFHIRLIRFKSNSGQTAAFDAGCKASLGEVIVTLDADLQNSPADIPLLLTIWCVVGGMSATTHG